jgi:hypothetical protein
MKFMNNFNNVYSKNVIKYLTISFNLILFIYVTIIDNKIKLLKIK